jgi:uncharacterized protein (DUF2126 family)
LRPAPHSRTQILSYSQRIQPASHFINWQQDPFSNYLARLNFREPTEIFEVLVELVARIQVIDPFAFFLESWATKFPFTYHDENRENLKPFLVTTPQGPLFRKLLKSIDLKPRNTVDFLVDLNIRLSQEIRYLIRMEPGVQTPEETLEKGSGSCRDTGWLLVELLRHLGLAARFVSGYLIQLKPDLKPLDGPAGADRDFTDLHAWAEVFLPGAGWVGLDPTSGLFAGEGHIPLACSPHPSSAAPIDGSHEKAEVDFSHEMSVERFREIPRVTLPYTDEQWERILKLGYDIDRDLDRHDVRLTMGGEPTFVSSEDYESAEWKTDALGAGKQERGEEMLRRLFDHYGRGGFLHHGQGKWYPGESLPRWSYGCYWRKDGQPIWSNPELLADIRHPNGATEDTAADFVTLLSRKLDLPDKFIIPGYEDAFYYLWKERRLPVNVDPFKSNLRNREDRERLAKVFEQGLDKVVGYTLPIERGWKGGRYAWVSGPWFLRPERMYLIPGDSPMGLRLPLDSVPWAVEADYRNFSDTPFFDNLPQLPEYRRIADQYFTRGSSGRSPQSSPWMDYLARSGGGQGKLPPHMRPRPDTLKDPETMPNPQESASFLVRTALCVEPRNGNIHVFMPPVPCTEDYIDLLTAIEATAAELNVPVLIEGYTPPHDPRVENLKVTPDPGVLEINIHPSSNWDELVERTGFLYEAARQSRLATEKFKLDGTHSGTGGGNHIIIGGASPSDSPLLRKPELLSSLLCYWQQRPSLSYLFSGMFIGPTSQAPRIDEARDDSLYELEIAMRELDKIKDDETNRPWLIDRLFRNLLVDVTGNTHRAEFCIDKLYPPESSSQRLGLLEFRAFEMPPHSRMSLVQQLLMRGLINRFWQQSYKPDKLTRWHTQLHDKWMLPHFIIRDIEEVVEDLRVWGMPFETEWFLPHIEFRFPIIGEASYRDIHLELRNAIEPWHVMGEEGSVGGTVRYVDSSIERMQVKLSGLTPDRYIVHCQGIPLPLHNTGVQGEYVCGVRYRAWQPPRCLHPTIPVHVPLRFEIFDKWSTKSIGGCTYHVEHPGGRNSPSFPVNAFEAESRRAMRFNNWFEPAQAPTHPDRDHPDISPDFPYTLDLRNPRRLRMV